MSESRLEREFRHRRQFLLDVYSYELVMIAGVWLSLKFMMQVNRDRERHKDLIKRVDSGKHPNQEKFNQKEKEQVEKEKEPVAK